VPPHSHPVHAGPGTINDMVDFLAIVSIVAFIAVFSGLIWALDRV
jgi:hypothetical protein